MDGWKKVVLVVVLAAVIVGAIVWTVKSRRGPSSMPEEVRAQREAQRILDLDMICHVCGAKIPRPIITEEMRAQGQDAINAVLQGYKCPECGESPIPQSRRPQLP